MAPVNNTRPAILGALECGDMTRDELAIELGILVPTIQYNLHRMRLNGELHIVGWIPPAKQGGRSAIYRSGPGRNVPMTRQTKAQRAASQAAWGRRKRMTERIKRHQGNPFGAVMAQLSAHL